MLKIKYYLLFVLMLILTSCGNNSNEKINYSEFFIPIVRPSLISAGYTVESMLVALNNRNILNIFCLVDGINGNQVGNNSRIVKCINFNSELTLSSSETIYNSNYDDRSSNSGIRKESIIVFF